MIANGNKLDPKEGMHRVKSRRIPDIKLPLSSGQDDLLPSIYGNAYGVLPTQEAHWSFSVQTFY